MNATTDRLSATYTIETAVPLEVAAASMAGEQSTGTFVKLARETDDLLALAAARVEALDDVGAVEAPSLPGAKAGDEIRRARVTLSWPLENMGPSLPNALATVAGNLFELSAFSGLRLEDVAFPPAFREAYGGPRFGVAGTRRLTDVHDRPLVGTIIKPSVGLSPEATAELVAELCAGGIDFIKDDELQADGPHCPFAQRLDAVMRVLDDHAERTGRRVMYAFNLTGEVDEMRARHDLVAARGGTCVMASLNSVGLSGFTALARHAELPIHAHRNGWGALSRHPMLGFSYVAWSKFWRLAGADHLHVNGIRNKFCEPDESVIASARSLLTPLYPGDGQGCETMPVFSSGQWAGQAADTFAAIGTTDLIYACGGGIAGHPDGIEAGVTSIREAWAAARDGVPIAVAARESRPLARAIETFGGRT